MPTKESIQLFDDIGFIIVNDEFTGQWEKIETYNKRRTDETFKWYEKIYPNITYDHKVVGYAMKKGSDVTPIWKSTYELTELNIVIGIYLCRRLIGVDKHKNGSTVHEVPCYHSCGYKEHFAYDSECKKYHGTLGGALVNFKTKKLFGVATWAETDSRLTYYLPVGFSVPNSDSYFEDYACSKKIRNSKEAYAEAGYYQELCDSKRNHNVDMTNHDVGYDTE